MHGLETIKKLNNEAAHRQVRIAALTYADKIEAGEHLDRLDRQIIATYVADTAPGYADDLNNNGLLTGADWVAIAATLRVRYE